MVGSKCAHIGRNLFGTTANVHKFICNGASVCLYKTLLLNFLKSRPSCKSMVGRKRYNKLVGTWRSNCDTCYTMKLVRIPGDFNERGGNFIARQINGNYLLSHREIIVALSLRKFSRIVVSV